MSYSLDMETVGPHGPSIAIVPDLSWDRDGNLDAESLESLRVLTEQLQGLVSKEISDQGHPIHIIGLSPLHEIDVLLHEQIMRDLLRHDIGQPVLIIGDPAKADRDSDAGALEKATIHQLLADVERTMKIAGPPPPDHRASYLGRNQAPRSPRGSRNRQGR